jgi:hypothetical protein
MKFPDFDIGFNAGSLALGAAVYFLSPIVAPIAVKAVKAIAKSGIKGGMVLYNTSKKTADSTIEYFQEITKEAKAEMGK